MKVYTKTGDNGTSAIFDGTRLSKTHGIFEVLGGIDELSSSLGFCFYYISTELYNEPKADVLSQQIYELMSRLIDVGAEIANQGPMNNTPNWNQYTILLERWIDIWTGQLPKLTNFILPSGGLSALYFHQARGICRRCERYLVGYTETLHPELLKFLNRLSDYLFTAARVCCQLNHQTELVYKNGKVEENQI